MATPKSSAAPEYTLDTWAPDNDALCPGYEILHYTLLGQPYSTMVRCDQQHQHQVMRKIWAGGTEERLPAYPWMSEGENRLATRAQALKRIERKERKLQQALKMRGENIQGLLQEMRKAPV